MSLKITCFLVCVPFCLRPLGLCRDIISIVCISKEILFVLHTSGDIHKSFFLLFDQHNCEERVKHNSSASSSAAAAASSQRKVNTWGRSSDKLQCAIYYAIDGDQVRLLAIFRLLILGRIIKNRTSIDLLGGKLMIPHWKDTASSVPSIVLVSFNN